MEDKDPHQPKYFKMHAILEKSNDELEKDGEELEEFDTRRVKLDDSDFDIVEDEDEENMVMDTQLSVAL